MSQQVFESVSAAILANHANPQCGRSEQRDAARILLEGQFDSFKDYLHACPGSISVETAGQMYSTWQAQQ